MRYYGYCKREKLDFSYHLTDHCNLNCKGCDNYSPIAKERYTDINVFDRDIKRIRELFDRRVVSIGLLGGEPLLNPDICDFFEVARRHFPEREVGVYIITNGLLLAKMSDEFWEKCRYHDIEVRFTKYPININYDEIMHIADAKHVVISEFGHKNVKEKYLEFLPFDLEGKQNIEENFKNCFHANRCIQVSDGYIYTCNIRAYIDFFLDRYCVKMEKSERDRINIHDDYTGDEILDFLSKPIPFCRYCNIAERSDGHIWRTNNSPEIYDWLGLKPENIDRSFLNRFDTLFFLIDDDMKIYYDRVFSLFGEENNVRIITGDAVDTTGNLLVKNKKNTGVILICDVDKFIISEQILVKNGIKRIYRLFI